MLSLTRVTFNIYTPKKKLSKKHTCTTCKLFGLRLIFFFLFKEEPRPFFIKKAFHLFKKDYDKKKSQFALYKPPFFLSLPQV